MRMSSAGRRTRLAAIVLAAGASSRLGHPKQLLRVRQEPLLVRSCRLAAAAVDGPVIAVIGAGRQRLRSLIASRLPFVTIVPNARWAEGLASSLGAGLARVPRQAGGVLILLVDQARIEARDLERLVARWRRRSGQPAAASYHGRSGAPAVIPRRYYPRLTRLEGDRGARQWLRELGSVSSVAMPRAAFDVDTPADALALSRSRSAASEVARKPAGAGGAEPA